MRPKRKKKSSPPGTWGAEQLEQRAAAARAAMEAFDALPRDLRDVVNKHGFAALELAAMGFSAEQIEDELSFNPD